MLTAGCLAQCLALQVLNLAYTRVSTKGTSPRPSLPLSPTQPTQELASGVIFVCSLTLPIGIACLQHHRRLQRLNLRGTFVHAQRTRAILAHVGMVDINRLQARPPVWDIAQDTDDEQLEGMDPEAALHT